MRAASLIRRINLIATGLGAAIFALALAYVSLAPQQFSEKMGEFLIAQTSDHVAEELGGEGLTNTNLLGSDLVKKGLDLELNQLVADLLAARCELGCTRSDQQSNAIDRFFTNAALRTSVAKARLEQLVLGQYQRAMEELRADFSLFAGSNAILMAIAFLLSVFRGRAAAHLVPVVSLLTLSSVFMSAWYLLGQNWIVTVLFSDYWGWAYPAFQGFIVAMLLDVWFNAGKITTRLVNALGGAMGNAFSLVPC